MLEILFQIEFHSKVLYTTLDGFGKPMDRHINLANTIKSTSYKVDDGNDVRRNRFQNRLIDRITNML